MDYTMRQFLKDLITRFYEKAQDENLSIDFYFTHDVMTGDCQISSSVCAYTLVLSDSVYDADKVVDCRAFIKDDSSEEDTDAQVEAMTEGTPSIKMPFTIIAESVDPADYDNLFKAFTTYHAFRSAMYLDAFSKQTKSE